MEITPEMAAEWEKHWMEAQKRWWEEFSAKRSERVRERMRELRKNGEVTGRPPLGYRIVQKENGKKIFEKDPVTWPLVQEARELYATGKYSLRKLCAVMEEKGLRSYTGRRVGPSSLLYALKNPAYPKTAKSRGRKPESRTLST